MKHTNRIGVLIFCSSIAFLAAPKLFAQYYTATDLGTLGGDNSYAFAINNSGLIVGTSTTAEWGVYHAFSYSAGVMSDLGTLGLPLSSTLGPNAGNFSEALGVNDGGLIVGQSFIPEATGGPLLQAFSDVGGVMTDLGSLGTYDNESAAYGVNDSGVIVGWTSSPNGATAFSESGGVMTNLGGNTAEAVSNSGLIVGDVDVIPAAITYHAASFSGGSVTDLGTLGGKDSNADAVNDSGLIVGDGDTAGGYDNAFSYFGGVMTDLGTLGGDQSIAFGVNDSGVIVGESTVLTGSYDAFEDMAGVMIDLNLVTSADGTDLKTLTYARDVNNEGEIVGYGVNALGDQVAFLLTPTNVSPVKTLSDYYPYNDSVPDIGGSALMLIIGLVGIAISGRCRQVCGKQLG